MRYVDDLAWAKLLNCRVVAHTWLLSIGVGAIGLAAMVAIG